MKAEIKRWGNSAAIRIPSQLMAAVHLEIDSPVRLTVAAGKLIIEPASKEPRRRLRLPFTEAQLLVGLNPDTAHADALASITSSEIEMDE